MYDGARRSSWNHSRRSRSCYARPELHYKAITERILSRGLWATQGKTPADTISARLAVDLQKNGEHSRFVRVEPGVFSLRGRVAGVVVRATPSGTSRKLTGNEIRELAKQIIAASPAGIRYGELLATIVDQHPETSSNTIAGSIWNLDQQFPREVHKPSRGLFVSGPKPVDGEPEAPTPPAPARMREDAFYQSFAYWLKNDIEDATEAEVLGGSPLRSKWGSPDVIGVYKSLPDQRIKWGPEIVSAEIKIDPGAPVVAFGQAVAYRLFSAKTYIVMPRTMGQDDRDRLDALCMLFGVGLVTFDLDPQQPSYRIEMRAQRFSPDMYFVNEFADGLLRHDRAMFNKLFG